MTSRNLLKIALLSFLSLLMGLTVCVTHAENSWPNKPVQIVVPFPAGGGTDTIARTVASELQKKLGSSFIVLNRPGADGLIATQQVAKAAPDGYTFVIGTTSTFSINQTFYKTLPYDPVNGFQPVSMLAMAPHVLVINPKTPAHTLKEYIEYCKTHQGKLNYASYGNGSTTQLITEMFKKQYGLDLLHIPYKGVPPALVDIMGGRVSMMISPIPPAVPLIESGKLRPLAIYGDKRVDSMSDVPTMAELGFNGPSYQNWYGLFAPAGTPRPIVDKLNSEIKIALARPNVQEIFAKASIYPTYMAVDAFTSFVKEEVKRWGDLVKLSGAHAG